MRHEILLRNMKCADRAYSAIFISCLACPNISCDSGAISCRHCRHFIFALIRGKSRALPVVVSQSHIKICSFAPPWEKIDLASRLKAKTGNSHHLASAGNACEACPGRLTAEVNHVAWPTNTICTNGHLNVKSPVSFSQIQAALVTLCYLNFLTSRSSLFTLPDYGDILQ